MRSNGKSLQPMKKEENWNKKARRRLSHIFSLLPGGGVCGESMAWGGEGFGQEGMLVREGSRVGWIEKTQRKTMECGLEEGSDSDHVFFSSPGSCSLLCFCADKCLCLSVLSAETRACVAAEMLGMCW